MIPRALSLVLCAGLAACITPAPYQRPEVSLPQDWRTQATTTSNTPDNASWWQQFACPELSRLQAQALAANPDLQVAIHRLLAAQDTVRETRAQQSLQLMLGAEPIDAAAVAALGDTNSRGRKAGFYLIGINARYELDFWGRIAAQVQARQAEYQASVLDAGTVQIALQNQVAGLYFSLLSLDEQIGLQSRRLALAQQAAALTDLRLTAGRVGLAATSTARQAQTDMEAQADALRLQRAQAQLQLALLLGQVPESFTVPAGNLSSSVQKPALPQGLPASLIARRPDILAAEQRLQAAHADVAALRAEQLPQITLTAGVGVVSGPLSRLVNDSRAVLGFGPDVSAPIFDGGQRAAAVDAGEQARQIAVLEYRKTIYTALADVESALLQHAAVQTRMQRLEQQAQAQQLAAMRTQASLQAGRASRFDTLSTEDSTLQLQMQAISNTQEQLESLLAVYAALGGGWTAANLPDTQQATEPGRTP